MTKQDYLKEIESRLDGNVVADPNKAKVQRPPADLEGAMRAMLNWMYQTEGILEQQARHAQVDAIIDQREADGAYAKPGQVTTLREFKEQQVAGASEGKGFTYATGGNTPAAAPPAVQGEERDALGRLGGPDDLQSMTWEELRQAWAKAHAASSPAVPTESAEDACPYCGGGRRVVGTDGTWGCDNCDRPLPGPLPAQTEGGERAEKVAWANDLMRSLVNDIETGELIVEDVPKTLRDRFYHVLMRPQPAPTPPPATEKALEQANEDAEALARALARAADGCHNSDDVTHFCDIDECKGAICRANVAALAAHEARIRPPEAPQ